MKNTVINISLSIVFHFFSLSAYAQPYRQQIQQLEKTFLSHPTEYSNYENLTRLISEHYTQLTIAERKEIRDFLSAHTHFSTIHIPPAKETGRSITIKGTVKNVKGSPLPNSKLFIFHTDARGYYAPTDSASKRMNEPDPRLFGYVVTDKDGRYSFETIHPGTYPNKYEGRYIPQHIHIQIVEKGFEPFSIQMAFEDDPAMKDPYWKDWAVKQKFPVTRLIHSGNILTGSYDIILTNL